MGEDQRTQQEPGAPVDDGLEAALEKIGGNTRWMWMVFVLASAPGIFNIWALTSFVFLAGEVDHWCHVPEFSDVNWTSSQKRIIMSGKAEEHCLILNYNYSLLTSLPFEEAELEVKKLVDSVGTYECESFQFAEHGTSIVEQWDLVCDRLVLLSNVQMVVALGKFVGALVFGFVADKWGRKCSFVISCVMYMVAGPIAGIFPVYELFVFARFILGMAGSGCYNCAFTLLTEVSNAERRTLLGILYNMSYPLGLVILALVAYLLPQWRSLQLATSIPALLLIINCWLIPESPRWLLSQGRRDEVWAIVKKADKSLAHTRATNMSSIESAQMMQEQTANTTQEEELQWKKNIMASLQKFSSLLCNGDLAMRLLISQYMWCVTALSYFALSLNADNFTTDRYIYMASSGVVEAISYVLPIPILSYIGRRHTSAAMFLLSGIALLSILAIPTDQTYGILAVAMVGRLCISAVYSVIILYTSELFPTENRNTAVGASSTMSHVGTIIAPYIVVQLGKISKSIPSTVCALLSLSAGLLVLLLPETRGKTLPDTVEEMKENAKKGDKVTIKNCCSFS